MQRSSRSDPVKRRVKKISPLKKRTASQSPKNALQAGRARTNNRLAGSGTDSDPEKRRRNRKPSVREILDGQCVFSGDRSGQMWVTLNGQWPNSLCFSLSGFYTPLDNVDTRNSTGLSPRSVSQTSMFLFVCANVGLNDTVHPVSALSFSASQMFVSVEKQTKARCPTHGTDWLYSQIVSPKRICVVSRGGNFETFHRLFFLACVT